MSSESIENDKTPIKARSSYMPLLPVRDLVVLPYMVLPLLVGREKSIKALEVANEEGSPLFLSAQFDARNNNPSQDDIHRTGTICNIIQMIKRSDGNIKVLVEGKVRGYIKEYCHEEPYFKILVDEIIDDVKMTPELDALMRALKSSFETYIKLFKKIPPQLLVTIEGIQEPGKLADILGIHLGFKLQEKQELLETFDVGKRLQKVLQFLEKEIEILQIERKIKNRVKKQMVKNQKEYYLTEQMQAIQKELGEKDGFKSEVMELEEKMKKKRLSKEAQEKVEKEIKKLKFMSPMSAEAPVVRNYIDWILSLPWDEMTQDKLDINEAERILNEDHYGLEQPKERILEYLAVRQLNDKMKGPIICFVGPPGVGKTSLAKSIARALGRNFVRLSLGGLRDEAEIRGHRRTYIGAMPGKIIQHMKRANSNNPVFLLDEIDKIGIDFRGDPAAALLEVLDPEQNDNFHDLYLDINYDLSHVMFITTANTTHGIPPSLIDRMEIIRIPGYTEYEKLCIAKKYLIPKQKKENGLADVNINFLESAIKKIIREYTREAGVRNLEREIANVLRKMAKSHLKVRRKDSKGLKGRITPKKIEKLLGAPRYRYEEIEKGDTIGLAYGLAWTEAGGELLATEVAFMPGEGKLIVTGKLGDVMQESARAALTYARSKASAFDVNEDFFRKIDIHIHIPEGAVPKDGPSAGITMACAIFSCLLKIPIKRNLAMTGEITLRGRILPVGGLKEKIIAAHRGHVETVIVPEENRKEIEEIPKAILQKVRIVYVKHMDEVLFHALKHENPQEFIERIRSETGSEGRERRMVG